MPQLKTLTVMCFCPHCASHFNVRVIVESRYTDVAIRFCPLCGETPDPLMCDEVKPTEGRK